MAHELTTRELADLVERVFEPQPDEQSVAILVDLPDAELGDNPEWQARRAMAAQWAQALSGAGSRFDPALIVYRNARANNADLPDTAWLWDVDSPLPTTADEVVSSSAAPMRELLARYPIALAPTELSATAPLKMLAPQLGIRAATMPGFSAEMVPALRLDYGEVNRRVNLLKDLLDEAVSSDLVFGVAGAVSFRLHLDLRHRTAHASGGLLPSSGTAGNLPSGEAYIVPYEGERWGDPSRSYGVLPVQLDGEIVVYQIEDNCAVDVLSDGPVSSKERELIFTEPAYSNLSELGLGVLAAFGVEPVGEVLLDEKLGLHIAFGRSEHFGGQVGPAQFSSPSAVTHQDRVYIPGLQPDIAVLSVDLEMPDGGRTPLMRDGEYVIEF